MNNAIIDHDAQEFLDSVLHSTAHLRPESSGNTVRVIRSSRYSQQD